MLLIEHATILTPEQSLRDGAVLVDDGRIAAAGPAAEIPRPPGATTLDAHGMLLCPGFIDLQVNGAFGLDFTADPATIWDVARGLPRYGVTTFLPTIITSPLEKTAQAREVVLRGRPDDFAGATPLGLHVEGPFLNPQKKGAHNPAYLRPPALEAVAGWSPDGGVRLVTLAPELPGALELIAALAERGVLVSAGHSMATYEEAWAGFNAGVRYGTHLFNAMPPLGHRAPGLPGALLGDSRPICGLIGDGIHTHPAIISLAWRLLGAERLNLVTDCMAALGMPPGEHVLGDYTVLVDETTARLPDGTLAGCILSLDRMLHLFLGVTGCTLAEALPTVTTTAARALGLQAEYGRIAPGYVADLVLLSTDLRVSRTFVAGNEVYTSA
jgi:N-acetylglucosamine-6-phosphate deacetylase